MGSIGNCDSREVPKKAVYKASLNNNFVTQQERARQIGAPRGSSRKISIILAGHKKMAPASAKSDTKFCSEKLEANECTIIHLQNQNWI